MSDAVTLTLRAELDHTIDAESISPDRFAQASLREIEQLPVWAGREQRTLGDYFTVRGHQSAEIRVEGDVRRANSIGAAMSTGYLTIEGNVGSHTGARMSGGQIEIRGNTGDDVASGMSGGVLHVRGNAGDRLAAGLPGASRGATGGEVVVEGSAGSEVGAKMRRGLVLVGGDAGDFAARSIIAGSVLVLGTVGREPATDSKRGSLVVGGAVDVPATYRHACRYEPPHVRLALMHLSRTYALSVDQRIIFGAYDRFCGDAGTVGKGEILVFAGPR
jgi:formylmethanofuran dehydrogenase subunit C